MVDMNDGNVKPEKNKKKATSKVALSGRRLFWKVWRRYVWAQQRRAGRIIRAMPYNDITILTERESLVPARNSYMTVSRRNKLSTLDVTPPRRSHRKKRRRGHRKCTCSKRRQQGQPTQDEQPSQSSQQGEFKQEQPSQSSQQGETSQFKQEQPCQSNQDEQPSGSNQNEQPPRSSQQEQPRRSRQQERSGRSRRQDRSRRSRQQEQSRLSQPNERPSRSRQEQPNQSRQEQPYPTRQHIPEYWLHYGILPQAPPSEPRTETQLMLDSIFGYDPEYEALFPPWRIDRIANSIFESIESGSELN